MKEVYIKVIPIFLFIVLIMGIGFKDNKNIDALAFNFQKSEETIKAIINSNDGTLNVNKKIANKFTYLEFQNADKIITYFVNNKTGEETNFYNYLKQEKKEEFDKKINELIYLKYPKFIADILVTNEGKKIYQLKDKELIIYFDNYDINPAITERLLLKVNYNEIKDYLDFTVLLDDNYKNEDGYHYNKEKKAVALTFDDGPSGEKTNQLVDVLKANKVHATFFMVGNKMEYGASVIRNVLANGNEIGSHSYAHKNMKRQNFSKLLEEENKTKEIYYNITGKDLVYTRPPYGSINKNIKEGLDTIFITWNIDPEDWLHRDKDYIVNYVLENISDGDIILMHDLYDTTIEAVSELLPKLYAEGYQVVSVSELANIKNRVLEKNNIYRSLKDIQ